MHINTSHFCSGIVQNCCTQKLLVFCFVAFDIITFYFVSLIIHLLNILKVRDRSQKLLKLLKWKVNWTTDYNYWIHYHSKVDARWSIAIYIPHLLSACSDLTLNVPCISESCVEIKINLNFYFHASLWCLKRFYEGLKLIFCLRPELGQGGLTMLWN